MIDAQQGMVDALYKVKDGVESGAYVDRRKEWLQKYKVFYQMFQPDLTANAAYFAGKHITLPNFPVETQPQVCKKSKTL